MRTYDISEPVRGAFSRNGRRVTYDLPVCRVADDEIDADLLARLVTRGHAVPVEQPESEGDES